MASLFSSGQISQRNGLNRLTKINWQSAAKEVGSVALLIILPFMVFWALWAPNPADRVIFIGDVLIGAYPTRVFVHRLLMTGEIPLWNPYQLGGMPLLADAQVAVYYLPNLALDFVYWGRDITYEGFEALIIAHYTIAGVFMYGYLRQQGIRPSAALIGAIAFEFNGFFVGHRGHYNMLAVVVWIPGVMWLMERAWTAADGRRAAMWAIGAGLLLSQLFMAGHPQLIFYSGLFLMAYVFYRWSETWRGIGAWWQSNWREKWGHPLIQRGFLFGIAGMLALSIAAVSLLPMFELLGRSVRSEPSYAFTVQFPLMPRNFITLLIPEFLNWSGTEFRIYAGIFTLVLAAVVWLVPEEKRPSQRFFTAALIIAAIMAMGGFTAVHSFLYRFVPGFGSVRVTARLFFFANLSLAVLAAYGADVGLGRLSELETQRIRNILKGSRWIFALLGAVAIGFYMLLIWFNQPVGEDFYFYESLFLPTFPDNQYLFFTQAMNSYMLFVIFFTISMGWLWFRLREGTTLLVMTVAAISLMTIDITTFATQHDSKAAPDFNLVGYDGFAIYQLAQWQAQDRDLLIAQMAALPSHQRIDNSAVVLPDNFSQMWPASFSTGYNVLDIQERFEIQNQWPEIPETLARDLMGVHWILTGADNPEPPEEGAVLLLENSQGKIWQRPISPNYAHFSTQVRPSETSITINGLLVTNQDNPFQQPAIASEEIPLTDVMGNQWLDLVNPARYAIGDTGVTSPVDIGILAGGSGNYSGIIIDGETVTPEERGLLVVTLDPFEGEVLTAESFDTYLSESESERFAATMNGLAEGTIVAVATYDEGTARLTNSARVALGQLGGAETLVDKFGQAYGLIGVKGAEPGTAVEQVAPEAVTLDVGIGATTTTENDTADLRFESQVVAYEQNRITLFVENNQTGLLTISETVFPGWHAYVNGEETPILRSNGIFRSVVLPPVVDGQPHEVTFVYDPGSIRLGIAVSVFSIIIALATLLMLVKRPM